MIEHSADVFKITVQTKLGNKEDIHPLNGRLRRVQGDDGSLCEVRGSSAWRSDQCIVLVTYEGVLLLCRWNRMLTRAPC